MKTFASYNLPQVVTQSLSALNFKAPTPIQEATIPVALEGKDILGTAQTGTGKTMAFGIPLICKLINNPNSSALVITPTRELATQVLKSLQQVLGKKSPIKSVLIIGGEPISKQLHQLKKRNQLIIGTPGRINDHLKRGSLKLNTTDFLVLDETDRMLDMGFSVQIEDIIKKLPEKRQTLLFSATLPKNIMKLANAYLSNPERIEIGSTINPAKDIKQEIVNVAEADKYSSLLTQLEKREGSIIIFVKTKTSADKMSKRLRFENHNSEAMHGDLRHSKREQIIRNFRNKKYRILVATDVVARGLDIPHIEHVINYDLPQCPEDYIHRIGRTARAGSKGESLCFVSPSDKRKWHAINYFMNPDAKPPAKGSLRPSRKKKNYRKSSKGGNSANANNRNDNRRFASKKPQMKKSQAFASR